MKINDVATSTHRLLHLGALVSTLAVFGALSAACAVAAADAPAEAAATSEEALRLGAPPPIYPPPAPVPTVIGAPPPRVCFPQPTSTTCSPYRASGLPGAWVASHAACGTLGHFDSCGNPYDCGACTWEPGSNANVCDQGQDPGEQGSHCTYATF